jgi:hypothetical protein
MNGEAGIWEKLKSSYLDQVREELAGVSHPNTSEILENVSAHLDQKYADLPQDQRTWENLQHIIIQMGPANDYVQLYPISDCEKDHKDPGAGLFQDADRTEFRKNEEHGRERKIALIWLAVAGICACIMFLVNGTNLFPSFSAYPQIEANEPQSYVVSFRLAKPKETVTAAELLQNFNSRLPVDVRTSYFRTEIANGQLIGHIRVDGKNGCERVTKMLASSDVLKLIDTVTADDQSLNKLKAMGQISLFARGSGNQTNIVVFKPVGHFDALTAEDLLEMFNSKHPDDATTHHFRTEIKDRELIGRICVDGKIGLGSIVQMLAESKSLKIVDVLPGTDYNLESQYNMKQVSLVPVPSEKNTVQTDSLVQENSSEARIKKPAGTSKSSASENQFEVISWAENGRTVDKVNYPFVDDPGVLGRWKSVDFVSTIEQFDPEVTRSSNLYLHGLTFNADGSTDKAFTWTRGLLLHSGDRTASRYLVKNIRGKTYMFMEWKSGDYCFRGQKPCYYVLAKEK